MAWVVLVGLGASNFSTGEECPELVSIQLRQCSADLHPASVPATATAASVLGKIKHHEPCAVEQGDKVLQPPACSVELLMNTPTLLRKSQRSEAESKGV